MNFLSLLGGEALIRAFLLGWTGLVGELIDSLNRWWERVRGSLRNPFTALVVILDATLQLITGAVGILLRFPIVGMRELFLQEMRKTGALRRIMTVESAIKLCFDSLSKYVNVITFTDESGIIEVVAQFIGRTAWRLRSRIKLLRALIAVSSEADAIRIVTDSFRRKAALFRWVGIVFGILAGVGILAVVPVFIGLGFLFMDRSPKALGVFPDNNRRRIVKGKRQTRTRT